MREEGEVRRSKESPLRARTRAARGRRGEQGQGAGCSGKAAATTANKRRGPGLRGSLQGGGGESVSKRSHRSRAATAQVHGWRAGAGGTPASDIWQPSGVHRQPFPYSRRTARPYTRSDRGAPLATRLAQTCPEIAGAAQRSRPPA
eukprot:scaffold3854_cov107-Isochrysis_galbana.AAC.9